MSIDTLDLRSDEGKRLAAIDNMWDWPVAPRPRRTITLGVCGVSTWYGTVRPYDLRDYWQWVVLIAGVCLLMGLIVGRLA